MKKLEYVAMGNNVINNNEISNTRKEVVYHARECVGTCFMCDFIHSIGRTTRGGTGKGKTRVETPAKIRGYHVCDFHKNVNNCHFSYGFEYFKTSGKPTAKCISQSLEVEVENLTLTGLAIMTGDFESAPTSDGSLYGNNAEFKTKIFLSLQGFTKLCGAIENCIARGYFSVTDNCGTHLHTSIYRGIDENGKPIPKHNYTYLGAGDTYRALFFPCCRYFNNFTENELIEFFGSGFRYYAKNPINMNNDIYDYTRIHETIFNVQHTYSLEFRLPRFSTAKRYRNIALFMQEVVTACDLFQSGEETAENVGQLILTSAEKHFPVNRLL